MKTLIFADFHLGTENIEDLQILTCWIEEIIQKKQPDRIVFNGDTFELLLPMEQSFLIEHNRKEKVLETILDSWQQLFNVITKSNSQQLIFIPGEHDYDLFNVSLREILFQSFQAKKVTITNNCYDTESHSLIIHGHELDYNRIFEVNGTKISCIDGLTFAINRYLSQTPEIEKKIRTAVQKGNFSYWYAYGSLPNYIIAVEQLFGADKKVYEREVAAVLRSDAIMQWLMQQKSLETYLLGKMVRTAALFPEHILSLYDSFYSVLEKIVDNKIRDIFLQKKYTDAPDYCFDKPVNNILLGHFHIAEKQEYFGRNLYHIPSPRVHVAGIAQDQLQLRRDLGYAVIDKNKVIYSVRN